MRIVPALIVACLLLTGCQSSAPTSAFDASAAAFIHKQGQGTIEGHAFFRSETGRVIYAAGEIVWLIPATPYADERFAALYGKSKIRLARQGTGPEASPAYREHTRQTKAESSGRFTFEKVGPGSYYVATEVSWREEGKVFASGGSVYERVTLTGKETDPVKVIVSGK